MNLFATVEQMLNEGKDLNRCSEKLWEQFGRDYAVLIIDSSGFTRTTREYGILPFLGQLVQVRRVATSVLKRCQAVSFKFEADNIYAYFENPNNALDAAFGIQEEIRSHSILLPDGKPFKVCSGIGYGRMLYSETLEGCFGDEMNLAAKLGEDVAEPDEVLLTQACYNALTSHRQEGFSPSTIDVSRTDITYYTQID